MVVDGGQCDRGQLSAWKDDQRTRQQRDSSNEWSVLFHLTAVARVDLNTLHTHDVTASEQTDRRLAQSFVSPRKGSTLPAMAAWEGRGKQQSLSGFASISLYKNTKIFSIN